MNILVTGAAGFIGFSVIRKLLSLGYKVIGIDNINSYYDPTLKYDRLKILGISSEDIEWNKKISSVIYPDFSFIRMNLEDNDDISKLFQDYYFNIVIHLGAQAGVRHSLVNPHAYISSNINGFLNILEGCRFSKVDHLVFASSSSVYGLNGKVPFSEKDNIAHPISLYAATKKSNELMAHAYSHLFNIPITGLRFFTVYGPWGRPDMSPFLFIDSILRNKPIKVFNNGEMWRDFTFIDDIVEGIIRISTIIPEKCENWDPKNPDPSFSPAPYRIYNIGNQHPIKLIDYIECIEKTIGREAEKEFMPMQPGDVVRTYADSSALASATNFVPSTPLEEGIRKTVEWFRGYYKL
ncbi:MAG: NAD-dependent epimerase [Muribaculaceae bacterium]|nr:NAD-dependent epimerase [Muribaculaceae bacterium]